MITHIANGLKYCWNLLLPLFLGIGQILRFVGRKIDFETGVIMITILGFGIPGFVRLGGVLRFVVRKVDMGTRVSILAILGLDISGFLQTYQDDPQAIPDIWGDLRTLIYVIAAALVIFSQNDLIAGASYTCVIIEVLVNMYIHLPLEYVYAGVSIDIVLAIVALIYGYIQYRAYQRRMRT